MKPIEEQRFFVPEDKFDRDQVNATYKSGLLRVVVPPQENVSAETEVTVNIVSEK